MTQTWRPNWKRLLLYSNYICTELKWPILFRILIWNGTAVCGISNCFRQRQRQFGCPSRGHIHAKEPPPGGPHRTKRTLEYAHSDPNETHTRLFDIATALTALTHIHSNVKPSKGTISGMQPPPHAHILRLLGGAPKWCEMCYRLKRRRRRHTHTRMVLDGWIVCARKHGAFRLPFFRWRWARERLMMRNESVVMCWKYYSMDTNVSLRSHVANIQVNGCFHRRANMDLRMNVYSKSFVLS